jgi:hypothetical protein
MVNPVKKIQMSKLNDQATTIVMGGLKELLNNSKYAYISKSNPKYSRLEEPGKEFVVNLVEIILPLLVEAQVARSKLDAEEIMLGKLST